MKRFLLSLLISLTLCGQASAAGNLFGDAAIDTAYNAAVWGIDTSNAASRKSISDKIEAMGGGVSITDAKYIVQQEHASLSAEQVLGALATGILKSTTTSGVLSIAVAGTDYLLPNGSGASLSGIPLDSDFTANGIMERKGSGDYTIASTDYVNAAWYGDNHTAIQTAIDTGAARVYVPSGTWSIAGNGTTADGIHLRSNLELFGDGANATIISQAASAQFAIAVGTSASEGGNSTADNYKNIYIHDLQILGDVVTSGFSEHYHAMSISGVSDVLIERVWFEGFRGDGLYIGSSHVGATERHNERITVRDCIFDGINKDNRNGLTIIDCDGALIENNYFTRTTKSTMPGAIDIEPNADNFAIIRNVIIKNNKFYDIGGTTAAIAYALPVNQATLTTPSRYVIIKNNYIDTCYGRGIYLKQTGTVSNSTTPNDILIERNSISNCKYGFTMTGVKNIRFENNSFQEITNGNELGDDVSNRACRDVFLTNNIFRHCGTSSGTGLSMYYSDVVTFDHNIFDDCGNATTHGYAMYFGAAGASSYVKLLNNTFIAPTGITTVAVKKHASHNFTSATNQYRGNDLHGLSNEFVSTNLWTDAEISDDLTLAKLQLDHNVETLAANKTLIITDKVIQKLDPDGTDRNVLLPAENTATDLTFFIYNMGGEVGEDLIVQDDAAADILSIGYLQLGFCTCDGTTWTVRCFSCAEAVCCINLRAKEENTSAIVTGQPVYLSGATGVAFPNAGLADCDDSTKIRVKGLAAEDISQSSTGYIRIKGLLENVNSTKGSPVNALSQDWTAGDQLWVSTTVGSLTNVRPIGRSIKVGASLTVEGSNSKILVDVRENSIYTGAASGEDITRQMGDSAGANKIIYEDFAGNEIASLDSDGNAIYNKVTTESIAVGASPTPGLTGDDNDTTVETEDWKMYGNATDAGTGSEDVDVYLQQQINSVLASRLHFDADGYINVLDADFNLETGYVYRINGVQVTSAALSNDSSLAKATGDVYTGDQDHGGANLEIPNSGTLPPTCTVGQTYMDTNATTGQRFYLCETTNNWVKQGDGAGGGSGSMTTVKENDVQVGGADIITIDFFGADFDLAETPDTEIQIIIAAALMRDAEWIAATTDAAGKSELATTAEVNTGTDTGRTITPDALAGSDLGTKDVCFNMVDSDTAVTTGNGVIAYTVPACMNSMDLINVVCSVEDKGVTATTDVQVRRRRAGVDADMLSTKITLGDEFFATDEVINASNDDVNTGDQIYADIDAIHSGTAPNGLSCVLEFRLP